MSFLKNNEQRVDIIYTKLGRFYKSIGSPKANITKWAVSDDGIDYNLYDPSLPVAERTQKIINTPQLASFTDGTALMHNKLFTITATNNNEIPLMTVSPNPVYFWISALRTSGSTRQEITVTINAPFNSQNGFLVTLHNSRYLYINTPPRRSVPDPHYGDRQAVFYNNPDNDSEIAQIITVNGSTTVPSSHSFKIIYDSGYEKLPNYSIHKTKISVESFDTGQKSDISVTLDTHATRQS